MPEQKTIKCPFCAEGEIKCFYTSRQWVTRYSRSAAAGKKAMKYSTPEKYTPISEKCPNCGKSKKEIEKALKEGIPPSREEVIRRAREAGLPLKF